ncbi:MAG: hypothetical protein HC906_00130 [Bacteroidales bacterium]|nr:hypothetical protein [Bacteroidales bacterium]
MRNPGLRFNINAFLSFNFLIIWILVVLVIQMFSSGFTFAQESGLIFNHLRSTDGLPSDNISVIYKDSNGYIWIGTETGLVRYDGYVTHVYRNTYDDNTSLPGNKVISIYETKDKLWFGLEGAGLCFYNAVSDCFIRIDSVHSNNFRIFKILESKNIDFLWLATNKGLALFNIKKQVFGGEQIQFQGVFERDFRIGQQFEAIIVHGEGKRDRG